ncbi:MAG: helix-turn-helix domain-containing protein [Endomicrobium sp.]|jgi:transcriptional regulator with XRE-family HTH domain|nr:helix-turn-helix domain-containing protein [Endomicrobium sp.]
MKKISTDMKIKIALAEAGLTQKDLGKKLGIKQAGVSKWITGTSAPRITTLKKIAEATGKPLQYFFDNSVSMTTGNNSPISSDKSLHYVAEDRLTYDISDSDEKKLLAALKVLEKEKEILLLKLKLINKRKQKVK